MKKSLLFLFFATTSASAGFDGWQSSVHERITMHEHYTTNYDTKFVLGCGLSKGNRFLTLSVVNNEPFKARGVLSFNVSVDAHDTYGLKSGIWPDDSTTYVRNPPQALLQEIKNGNIADIEIYKGTELIFKNVYSLKGSGEALKNIYQKCAL
ncbi:MULTISPECIES: hypothetical protein [Vibrio harveyi group]|uniref:hypothetical protein n=1 Tax=Vibrio harveyi group TaxID=717610 RepID=UPI00374829AC|nr:hypothetical protein [Vibrio parahaemolyticus]EIU7056951.1 hypothetical protein [Vibrio parahaemolyticus]